MKDNNFFQFLSQYFFKHVIFIHLYLTSLNKLENFALYFFANFLLLNVPKWIINDLSDHSLTIIYPIRVVCREPNKQIYLKRPTADDSSYKHPLLKTTPFHYMDANRSDPVRVNPIRKSRCAQFANWWWFSRLRKEA